MFGHTHRWIRPLLAAVWVAALAACEISDSPAPTPAPDPVPPAVSAVIGPAGGTLTGPDGVQLVVPPGALTADTTLRIARGSAGAPALPAELRSDLPIYEITPHDLEFERPVQVRLPMGGTPGEDAGVLVASPTEPWTAASDARFDGQTAVLERRTLSWYYPMRDGGIVCRPIRNDPYPCQLAVVGPGVVSTTPAGAIAPPASVTDVSTITRAALLNLQINYSAARDCGGARLQVVRFGPTPRNASVTLLDQEVLMNPRPNSPRRSGGSLPFQIPVDASLNGSIIVQLRFTCTRAQFNERQAAYAIGTYRVAVDPAPAILVQPADVAVTEPARATFSVTASGLPAPTFQWQRNNGGVWNDLPGATEVSYITPPTSRAADHGAQFRVVVRNSAGTVTSSTATLTVNPVLAAPTITQPPAAQSVGPGGSATFSVIATGSPPPNFSWSVNGTTVSAGAFTAGACAGSASVGNGGANLTLSSVTAGCNGATVTVTAINGILPNATASATLTVAAGAVAPVITQQPSSQTFVIGGGATFTVLASGTPPPSFLWNFNGSVLPTLADAPLPAGACAGRYSALGASLTLTNLSSGCHGATLFVTAGNSAGAATSNTVTLTLAAPVFTQQPQSVTVFEGQPASFNAAVANAASVQWERNGAAIAGATSNTYTLATASLADSGAQFRLRACSLPGGGGTCVLSDVAVLTVRSGTPPSGGACFGGPFGWCYVQPSPNANRLRALAFNSTGELVVGGDVGTFQRSTDFGNSWNVRSTTDGSGARHGWRDLALPNSTRIVAISGESGIAGTRSAPAGIYVSIDGGVSWTPALAAAGLTAVAFQDANVGVAVGGTADVIWRTADGGSTWSAQPVALAGRELLRVAHAGGTTFVAVGDGGAIWRSADAGLTWTSVASPASERITDLAFNGAGIGLAVVDGPSGRQLLRTADFGVSWQAASIAEAPAAVAFASATVAAAIGRSGETYRSVDAGASWSAPNNDSIPILGGEVGWRLRFANATTGIAVGRYGAVARTDDGGQTWVRLAGGSGGDGVEDLRAAPDRSVVLGVLDGLVKRSVDGGCNFATGLLTVSQ